MIDLYVVYMHTNKITNKSYIGFSVRGINARWKIHLYTTRKSTKNNHFHNALKKYGTECWEHKVLYSHPIKDINILKEKEKEFIKIYDTFNNGYNMTPGGDMFICKGKIVVKNNFGKTFQIDTNDERYLSGELVHHLKGKITVRDELDKTKSVTIDEFKTGKYISIHKNKVTVKDSNGNTFQVDKNDSRYLNGELQCIYTGFMTVFDKESNTKIRINKDEYDVSRHIIFSKNKIVVIDKNGNILQVDINDPRYISGELIHINKGMFFAKDKFGNIFKICKNDPRYLSGELVGMSKGKSRNANPQEIVKCPYCEKEGGISNLKRYHFENCSKKIKLL